MTNFKEFKTAAQALRHMRSRGAETNKTVRTNIETIFKTLGDTMACGVVMGVCACGKVDDGSSLMMVKKDSEELAAMKRGEAPSKPCAFCMSLARFSMDYGELDVYQANKLTAAYAAIKRGDA